MRRAGVIRGGSGQAERQKSGRCRPRSLARRVRDASQWASSTELTANSEKASAISTTTSACEPRRLRRPADARTPSLRTLLGAVRMACRSGARLDSTLATGRRRPARTTERSSPRYFLRPGQIVRGQRHDRRRDRQRQQHASGSADQDINTPSASSAPRVVRGLLRARRAWLFPAPARRTRQQQPAALAHVIRNNSPAAAKAAAVSAGYPRIPSRGDRTGQPCTLDGFAAPPPRFPQPPA